ncbi:MAG TPA: hypothetical protein VHV30_13365 [Polyangiaceae bacterium]|nr:hypothetical protein [Polyangiaceae bacterium]
MHDPAALLLLAIAAVALAIQSWRLGRQRDRARAGEDASARETERRAAAEARSARAIEGEAQAAAILAAEGYDVLAAQVNGSWTVHADGEPLTFGLRADYLVARAGRRFIAEVKTGRIAPRLAHGPTRRQLLEYSAAFDVHGVVLVDADARTVTRVELPLERGLRRGGHGTGTLAIVAMVLFTAGVVVGTALQR